MLTQAAREQMVDQQVRAWDVLDERILDTLRAVPRERFVLLCGADQLTTYEFNTGTAKHLFCAVCGIKSFYVPRSRPDGYSVNVRCLDAGTFSATRVRPFDGQRWEHHVASIGTDAA